MFGLNTGTTLWFNDGHGAFTAATSGVPAFIANGGVALGDVDGDGDLDLVLGNNGSTINNQVWLNDGHGAFAAGPVLEADYTRGVTLADLDRDGDLDIATANGCSAGACTPSPLNRIWLGDGRGNFREPVVRIDTQNTEKSVAAADIDGDNDLVTPDEVWRNDGDGGFTRIQQLFFGIGPSSHVVLGDLDADGDPDLVMSDSDAANNTFVWFNNNGVFTRDTSQTLTQSDEQGNVALSDIDGDGDLDLLIWPGKASTTIQLATWLNDGQGRFSLKASLSGIAAAGYSSAALTPDLDGDGDPDAILWFQLGTGIAYLNDGSGTFSTLGLNLSHQGLNGVASTLRAADFDGDGDPDLAPGYDNSTGARIWLNDGKGAFTDSGQTLGSQTVFSLATADLDGDGDIDLVTTDTGGKPAHAWINDGNGAFSDAGEIRIPDADATSSFFAALLTDLDGDGAPDLALSGLLSSGAIGRGIQIYRNAAAP